MKLTHEYLGNPTPNTLSLTTGELVALTVILDAAAVSGNSGTPDLLDQLRNAVETQIGELEGRRLFTDTLSGLLKLATAAAHATEGMSQDASLSLGSCNAIIDQRRNAEAA